MKLQADLGWKKPLIVLAIMLLAIGQFVVAQNLGTAPADQRGRARTDRRTTGRRLPELHQLDRQRDRAGRVPAVRS